MMKYCPHCRTEYEDHVRSCSDCGVELAGSLLPERLGQEPVIVLHASTAHEAQISVATLQAEGVPAYTADPDIYIPQLGNPVATITPEFIVWVPADAREAALRILGEPPITENELLEVEQAHDPDPDVDEETTPVPA